MRHGTPAPYETGTATGEPRGDQGSEHRQLGLLPSLAGRVGCVLAATQGLAASARTPLASCPIPPATTPAPRPPPFPRPRCPVGRSKPLAGEALAPTFDLWYEEGVTGPLRHRSIRARGDTRGLLAWGQPG